MKVRVDRLKEGEHEFSYVYPNDEGMKHLAGVLEKEGFLLRGPFEVFLHLTKLEPDFYLRGKVSCATETTCARCAEPFDLGVLQSFELALTQVSENKREKIALGVESETPDTYYFSGNEMDFEPIVREQFFLGVPYQALCQEGCKGICQSCGQNLNEKSCGCESALSASPFSVLKKFK